ncbi:GerAB/ArcD/ProY family transporter [Paenibacillus lignilyticus]|uniref:GerAB/ArcD/ProY family transporter n=1 Tax=Paenibacillus lignilyticus TaxID=1172615 RepID=A0ABS5CJ60_9BACL|nr:GerAB/ArcD/ProY family transporter [Paenibacillus lignilyticus]MBP3965844.1 GerAB/ArcD/ProY family transporter [Paenibacillus lignilyticus]
MKTANLPIGPIQLFCLIFQAQFGLGVLSLPHAVDADAGQDGWIACLFCGLINLVLLLVIWKLSEQNRSITVFQMLRRRLGPWLGGFFNLAIAAYSITVSYETLANWVFISNLWAYENTPSWLLSLLLVGGCAFLVAHPVRVFARFAVFAMAFVPLFIALICYTLKDANLDYILPVFSTGLEKISLGAWNGMMSYAGVGILMVLSPHIQMPSKSVLRIAIMANIAITAVYMLSAFSTTAIFSTEMIGFIREPLLFQFKTVSFKIMERTDLMVQTIWILFIMTSLSTYLLLFKSAVTALANARKGIGLASLLAIALILISIGAWKLHVSQLTKLQDFIALYVPTAAIGMLLMMLIMVYLHKWLSGRNGARA